MNYYYADSQNNTGGPVTWDRLEQMIRSGALRTDPMVVPEGASKWRPLSIWGAQNTGGNPTARQRRTGLRLGTIAQGGSVVNQKLVVDAEKSYKFHQL
jgi:hypothetical protein